MNDFVGDCKALLQQSPYKIFTLLDSAEGRLVFCGIEQGCFLARRRAPKQNPALRDVRTYYFFGLRLSNPDTKFAVAVL